MYVKDFHCKSLHFIGSIGLHLILPASRLFAHPFSIYPHEELHRLGERDPYYAVDIIPDMQKGGSYLTG